MLVVRPEQVHVRIGQTAGPAARRLPQGGRRAAAAITDRCTATPAAALACCARVLDSFAMHANVGLTYNRGGAHYHTL